MHSESPAHASFWDKPGQRNADGRTTPGNVLAVMVTHWGATMHFQCPLGSFTFPPLLEGLSVSLCQ